jgi:hypothetical protein
MHFLASDPTLLPLRWRERLSSALGAARWCLRPFSPMPGTAGGRHACKRRRVLKNLKNFSAVTEPLWLPCIMDATGLPKSPQTPGPSPSEADRKVGFFFAPDAPGSPWAEKQPTLAHQCH